VDFPVIRRCTVAKIRFDHAFVLLDGDLILPAGTYEVETEEEEINGVSFPAFRRVLTVLRLPWDPTRPGVSQTVTVDPQELDSAISLDRQSRRTRPKLFQTTC
jgi:hypothetical protein